MCDSPALWWIIVQSPIAGVDPELLKEGVLWQASLKIFVYCHDVYSEVHSYSYVVVLPVCSVKSTKWGQNGGSDLCTGMMLRMINLVCEEHIP